MKKRFNVDSPSFTPSSLAPNGNTATSKAPGLSPRAANAAPFLPKSLTPGKIPVLRARRQAEIYTASSVASFSSSTAPKTYNPAAPDWIGSETPEFLPQNYNNLHVSVPHFLAHFWMPLHPNHRYH